MTEQEINVLKEVFGKQQSYSLILRTENYRFRLNQLKKLEKWIFDHRTDIQQAIYADFKKPSEEVDIAEIYPVISEIRKTRKKLKYWVRPTRVGSPITYFGTRGEVYYEPKGVSLIISPWNYPFQLAIGPLISAIAAGNTAIIKPSELTPHTSDLIKEMVSELYADSYIAVITGGVEVSTQLLALPFDHIFFTGSPRVGKIVMEAAAKNLTSVTLELGGKSPAIIDENADIKDAAGKIAWGKWLNAGQTCIAPDYLLVHEKVAKEFANHLQEQVKHLYGDFSKYSWIVTDQHTDRLIKAVKEAVSQGAQLVFGDGLVTDRKMEPVLLSDVPDNTVLMDEEIFGPVLPMKTYTDIKDAIDYINSKPKPLALYQFSKEKRKVNQVKESCTAGMMCVNDSIIQIAHPNLPIGGIGNSGMGKAHGIYGFREFSNEKAVLYQRRGMTIAKTVYPPFNRLKKLNLDILVKYF
jgi:aldehyde dehydrogenase (NAD+)